MTARALLVLLALLAVPAAAHSQNRQKVGEVAMVELFAPLPDESQFACSQVDKVWIIPLVIGYLQGRKDGIESGAAFTTGFLQHTDTSIEAVDTAIEALGAPILTYGAYSSQLAAICDDYPRADVRDALTATVSKIRDAMGGGR